MRRFAGACWRRRNNMQATALPLAGRPARGLRGRPLAAHTVSVTAPQSGVPATQSATAAQASQAPGRVERGWGGRGRLYRIAYVAGS